MRNYKSVKDNITQTHSLDFLLPLLVKYSLIVLDLHGVSS